MDDKQRRLKNAIKTFLGIIAIIFIYFVFIAISRIGETKTTFIVIPENSEIYVNDKRTKGLSIYLSQGKYSVSARSEGYEEDTVEINVVKNAKDVILLPKPVSQEALTFLSNNPEVQSRRESLGGQRADQDGQKLIDKNRLLPKLPYTDILGPFSIDYSLTPSTNDKVALIISDSSPDGRQNALKWIRQQNQDPSEYEIIYQDFVNPLALEDIGE